MTDQEVIAMLVDLGYESTTITFDTSGSTDNDVIVVALKDLRNFENEWQHLRSLVPETKRWPMGCITEWSLRQGFAGDGTASAHETLRIAQHYDSDAVFADYEPSAYRFLSLDPDLTVLTKSLGLDPQILERWIQEGHAELGFLASRRDIER
jgi:xanthine/CO dehydrogenase XdhC/CoxF family maturation factor